jgi:ankyrin repeat protein
MTPLMIAAKMNNLDMVKVLLDAKAQVNVKDKVS